jgi:hypothetical protein
METLFIQERKYVSSGENYFSNRNIIYRQRKNIFQERYMLTHFDKKQKKKKVP